MTEIDANTLWAVASDGIYESTDAGKSWDKSANGNFAHISAPTPSDLWVVGNPGLYHSADAGNSWAPVSADSNNGSADTVSFRSNLVGFVAGTFHTPDDSRPALYIARTADGGTTWDEITGKPVGLSSPTVLSIRGIDPNLLLAYSWEDDSTNASGTIVATSDGGAHWTGQAIPDGGGALVAASYRGIVPWALTHDGDFLHFGPLPKAATPTPLPQPSAIQPAPPTDTLTPAAVVTFAFQPVAPTATATPEVPHLQGVSPRTVIQGSGAVITVHGSNLDPNATISIGDNDITNADQSPGGMQFSLPPEIPAGKFDVHVENPDGTVGVLHQALTVLPKLTLTTGPEHASVGPGFSLEATADTLPGTSLLAVVRTSNAHPVPHIVASVHQ